MAQRRTRRRNRRSRRNRNQNRNRSRRRQRGRGALAALKTALVPDFLYVAQKKMQKKVHKKR